MKKRPFWLLATAALAGLIYNSWLLGYWLNPSVARHDLASELEAMHQPFNWLFVAGDIVCGLLIIGLAYRVWRAVRPNIYNRIVLVAYASFGLLTLVDALLPLRCDPSVMVCPDLAHDPLLLAHGIFSIAASVGLFLAVFMLWWQHREEILLQLLIIGYVLFGLFSIISLITPGQDSWAQHYSLLLDGVCIMVVPFIAAGKQRLKRRKS